MKNIFKESISFLHKLWCAYIRVLFFKLMDNFNIFVSKAKGPRSFSCYKCLTFYFVAKRYFKIHRGAVPLVEHISSKGERCSTRAIFTVVTTFISGLDEESL